jgi:hypothetical protein
MVALIFSAITWLFTRRHSRVVAHAVLSLLKRASEGLVEASRYAPEAEGYRQRYERYVMGWVMLAFWVLLLGVFSVCLVSIPLRVLIFNVARITQANLVVVLLLCFAGLVLGRYCLVGATWAWHSLKTGEAVTWPWP